MKTEIVAGTTLSEAADLLIKLAMRHNEVVTALFNGVEMSAGPEDSHWEVLAGYDDAVSKARLIGGMSTPEPAPQKSSHPPVWDMVLDDMRERDRSGRAKYGEPLSPFNGRRALVDAYQEALDLVVYLRQAIYEEGCIAEDIPPGIWLRELVEARMSAELPALIDILADISDTQDGVPLLEAQVGESWEDQDAPAPVAAPDAPPPAPSGPVAAPDGLPTAPPPPPTDPVPEDVEPAGGIIRHNLYEFTFENDSMETQAGEGISEAIGKLNPKLLISIRRIRIIGEINTGFRRKE
jgi:hypothetical protein